MRRTASRARAGGRAGGRAPAPGSSRRAPSSARPPREGAARRRGRAPSWPAGASRPTSGAAGRRSASPDREARRAGATRGRPAARPGARGPGAAGGRRPAPNRSSGRGRSAAPAPGRRGRCPSPDRLLRLLGRREDVAPFESDLAETIRPGGGTRSRRAREVTLLPHPDSPTRATVSPRATSKEIPSTTRASSPDAAGTSRRGAGPRGEDRRPARSCRRDDSGRLCYGSRAMTKETRRGAASSPAARIRPRPVTGRRHAARPSSRRPSRRTTRRAFARRAPSSSSGSWNRTSRSACR